MDPYERTKQDLLQNPRCWLVTGVAGFIGSNLLQKLLLLNQQVVGLDNFSTGKSQNLEEVRSSVGPDRWAQFKLIQGDILEEKTCHAACQGVDFVLHQAALGSVPGSIANPAAAHQSNVTGFLNMLMAARDGEVARVVYASSSAVYGDDASLPKKEQTIGAALSPYAATKFMDELYAGVFARCFGVNCVGLRYFNVFGPRQDPAGAYAAVIPLWIASLLRGQQVFINGDGETSRDFCFVEDVVQANILAATTEVAPKSAHVCNVGLGQRTTLNELFNLLQTSLRRLEPALPEQKPSYRAFREGDVRHSMADISRGRQLLGYNPQFSIALGLECAMEWYRKSLA